MECPTIPWDRGMGWTFYGISGQHSIVKIHGKHGTNTKNNNFCLCSLISEQNHFLVGYPLNFSGQ